MSLATAGYWSMSEVKYLNELSSQVAIFLKIHQSVSFDTKSCRRDKQHLKTSGLKVLSAVTIFKNGNNSI
jgi:hypothetical protein